MTRITIRQTAELNDSPNATLSFAQGGGYPITVRNPFTEAEEERLAWYFEEHLRFPFIKQVIAEQAAQSVTAYGEALFDQLFKAEGDIYVAYQRASQSGLQRLHFEIIGTPAFHQLHWEALREPGRDPFVLHAPMIRRGEDPIRTTINVVERPGINVLLVTARPHGRRDVGYRTISRPLIEGLRRVNIPVQVDLVRPGSYRTLVEHLRQTQQRQGVGHYQIIHFDLHGAVLPFKALADIEGVSPHTYRVQLKDRYGRRDLTDLPAGEAAALKAFLFFEADRENTLDAAEADELAQLLREYQIPIALLNACQSGKQIGESETSLGSRLLQAGVQTVIAMGYSVTVSGAALMMQTLYRSLLERQDLLIALQEARLALRNEPQRRAHFNQQIRLEDWLLPVVYQPGGEVPTRLPLRPETLPEQGERLSREQTRYQAPEPTYGFVGRDVDILEIEKRLLSQSEGKARNLLLVRGLGGAGKTTLLRHLGEWWQKTGLVDEVFYFGYDEQAYTPAQIMDQIARQLFDREIPAGLSASPELMQFRALQPALQAQTLAQRLRTERHLLLLDNLESITGEFLAIPHTLPAAEQAALRHFLAALLDGRTLVLLGSRSGEDWLRQGENAPLRPNDLYDLPGLDPEAASTLAERILARHVPDEARRETTRKSEAFQQLLDLLAGYPLPLEVVLANLAHHSPAQVLADLRAGETSLDPAAQATSADDSAARTQSIIRCIEYAHSNLDAGSQQLLLCLFPFSGVVRQDQLAEYTAHLQAQPPLADLPFERWAEVLETVQNRGLLTPHEQPGFLRLQPIFPYFLKTRLGQQPPALRRAIETAFWQHYDRLGGALASAMQSKEAQEKQTGQSLTHLEYENLYTALHLALEAKSGSLNAYWAISRYLDTTQERQRALALGEEVLNRLEAYPAERLQDELAYAFLQVVDDIAQCQLLEQLYPSATTSYERLLSLLADLSDKEVREREKAHIYHQLGRIALAQRQWKQAKQYYQQSLQIKIDFNDRYAQASTYHNLGCVAQEQRQWKQAEQYYQQALHIDIDYNNHYSQASTYHNLGYVAQAQCQWEQAEDYYGRALQIYIDYKDHYSQARTYHQLGRVAEEQRQWLQAEDYFLKALEIYAESNDEHNLDMTYRSLARLWQAHPDTGFLERIAAILNVSAAEAQGLLEEKEG